MKPFSEPMLLEHPNLNADSVVIEAGGYKGWWAGEINRIYGSTVHTFEPISEFYHDMVVALQGREKIHTVHGALMPSAGQAQFGVKGSMSGAFCGDPNSTELVTYVPIESYLVDHGIRVVDLLALNCEGAEFGLLEYLIRTGLLKDIDRIIVQPHAVVSRAEERWTKIRQRVQNTHELIFSSPWCWDGYHIRPDAKKEREAPHR